MADASSYARCGCFGLAHMTWTGSPSGGCISNGSVSNRCISSPKTRWLGRPPDWGRPNARNAGRGWSCSLTGNCSCLHPWLMMPIARGKNPCRPLACLPLPASNATTGAFSCPSAHPLNLPNRVVFRPAVRWAIVPPSNRVLTSFTSVTNPPMSRDALTLSLFVLLHACRLSDALCPFV